MAADDWTHSQPNFGVLTFSQPVYHHTTGYTTQRKGKHRQHHTRSDFEHRTTFAINWGCCGFSLRRGNKSGRRVYHVLISYHSLY